MHEVVGEAPTLIAVAWNVPVPQGVQMMLDVAVPAAE